MDEPQLINKPLLSFAREMRKTPTPAEYKLWEVLKKQSFEKLKFRRQQIIGNYILDFVCFSQKLVIEIDGEYHNEESQKKYDHERTDFLQSRGFRVLRFWNEDVMEKMSEVLENIKNNIR